MKVRVKRTNWAEHQRIWWDLPNFIKILVGGFGCGKTWVGSLRAIYLSYLNSGILGMYVSPTFPIAELTTIPIIKDILSRLEQDYTYNQTKHIFHILRWDGFIKIASGDDPVSLKGGNMAWAGIDEPFVQKRLVFEEVQRRVRHPLAKHKEIFMTGTPEELGWGYDLCMNTEKNYDVGFVYGKTKDNLFLGGENGDYYKGLFAAYSEQQRKAYLEGNFLNLMQGRVYGEFDRDKNIYKLPRHEAFDICAGLDFNVDYMTAEIFYNMGSGVHFFDELRMANTNTFELAEKLRQKYANITIYPDPTGGARKTSSQKTDFEILKSYGYNVCARQRVEVRDRINAVNRMFRLKRASIEPGTCPWLVKDLERDVWKSGDIDKTEPTLTHAGDAAGYAIEYLYPVNETRISYYPR